MKGGNFYHSFMKSITLPYGEFLQTSPLPDNWEGTNIQSAYQSDDKSFETMVREALETPIESPRLKDMVKKGETVCLVFSDITRSWQQTNRYLPLLVEELEKGGVLKEDITLLCALGTHRPHSKEEKRKLVGSLYGKYRFVDHNCDDSENCLYLGTTSRGTEVEINRIAAEADHLILTGGIVFHLMAGYSGGRKSLLPGISSRKTIMQNHSLSLHPEKGKGSHPDIGCDKIKGNHLHEDLEEAADFLKPSFLVNIVPGKSGPGAVVAGHYREAHKAGCARLRDFFLIAIPEKRDVVIASAGGFPGDINFYQTVKSLINSCEALNPGGHLILTARCHEGLGNPLMEEMIQEYPDMKSRESFLRENYTIGRFIAYYGCELASRYKIYFVSDMDPRDLIPAGIRCFSTLKEAVEACFEDTGPGDLKFYRIPDSSHSFPSFQIQ